MSDPAQRLREQLQAVRTEDRKLPRMISINWTLSAYRLIKRAAEVRGISLSGFCRRAAVAMACQVLDLDYYEESIGERGVRAYGESGGHASTVSASKDGLGYGEWRIKELG